MTPYNPARWSEGMGAFMVTSEQMFPNRKMQRAEQRYMGAMSGMEVAERGVMQNMFFAEAKTAYYNWLVSEMKIAVLEESKNALRLLIESAQQRFQYNREKLGSIYKAQTELASNAAPASRIAHAPDPGPRSRSHSHGPAIRLTPLPTAKSAMTPAPWMALGLRAATSKAE